MSELIYSLCQEPSVSQTKLVLEISLASSGLKRQLYRDMLPGFAKDKESELLAQLIKEELRFSGISPLSSQADTHPFNKVRLPLARSKELLKQLAMTRRLFFKGQKIVVDPFSSVELYCLASKSQDGGYRIEWRWKLGSREGPITDCAAIFPGDPPFLIKDSILQWFKEGVDWKAVSFAPKELAGKALENFIERHENVIWQDPPPSLSPVQAEVWPQLQLTDRSGGFANLWMDYGAHGKVAALDGKKAPWRDMAAENGWEKDLLETGFLKKQVGNSCYYCPLDQVARSLSFLLEIGWKVYDFKGRQVMRQGQADLLLELKEEVCVQGKVRYEEHAVNLRDVMGAFNRRERFVELAPNAVGLLDAEAVEQKWGCLGDAEWIGESARVKKNHFGQLESFLEDKAVQCSSEVRELIEGARDISEVPAVGFCGTLHPYQQEGLKWLCFLEKWGFGGVLADEMGLGKTVQVLAFLSHLPQGAHLIVAPTSLLFNWRREIEKFLPDFPIYIHSGPERLSFLEELQTKPVILTSYAILRLDFALMQSVNYHCIILDEAQLIKNPESQVAQAAYALKGKLRLVVSGTPIENRLEDLWSLFHFAMPDLLDEMQVFRAKVLAAQSDPRYLKQIQKKTRPFLLRRTKELVGSQLPPKEVQTIWVEMSDQQRALYEEWLFKTKNGLLKKIESQGVKTNRMEILEAILRLRQLCCHPLLVDSALEGNSIALSAKLERVISDIQEVADEGGKVLVYSQFTQMLHLIEKELKQRNLVYVYLDGSTKDREAVVEKFQNDPDTPIFLISLKAGGIGLNLTSADYVFLFDPWWNEAVEAQAIDRAHRMGRTGAVIARRYVTALSIEEKLMRLKEHKKSLAHGVLEGEAAFEALTINDLKELLTG